MTFFICFDLIFVHVYSLYMSPMHTALLNREHRSLGQPLTVSKQFSECNHLIFFHSEEKRSLTLCVFTIFISVVINAFFC